MPNFIVAGQTVRTYVLEIRRKKIDLSSPAFHGQSKSSKMVRPLGLFVPFPSQMAISVGKRTQFSTSHLFFARLMFPSEICNGCWPQETRMMPLPDHAERLTIRITALTIPALDRQASRGDRSMSHCQLLMREKEIRT